MPATLIEVRKPYTPAEEVAIVDAVHEALVDAFRIPPQDKTLRLVAHEPHGPTRVGTPLQRTAWRAVLRHRRNRWDAETGRHQS